MATIRRLSDVDVRSVFEFLNEDGPYPAHLPFQVVPVGPHGQKLSPPSYEFPDGLYVLLKPEKKRKSNVSGKKHTSSENTTKPTIDRSKVPPHLVKFLMWDTPPETCPWSLSGPQFPKPTAIQQRYCYPRGDLEYSSKIGGALWTMYDKNSTEDFEFRLLHVYFSAKRAVNKGVTISEEERKMPAEVLSRSPRVASSRRTSPTKSNGNKRAKTTKSTRVSPLASKPKPRCSPNQQRQQKKATSPISRKPRATTTSTTKKTKKKKATASSSAPIAGQSSPVAGTSTLLPIKLNDMARTAYPFKNDKGPHSFFGPPNTVTTPVQPSSGQQPPDPFHRTHYDNYAFGSIPQPHYYSSTYAQETSFGGQPYYPVPSFENNSNLSTGSNASGGTGKQLTFVQQQEQQQKQKTSTVDSTIANEHFKEDESDATGREGKDDSNSSNNNKNGHGGQDEEPFPCDLDESFPTDTEPYWNDTLIATEARASIDYGSSNSPGYGSVNHFNNMDIHRHPNNRFQHHPTDLTAFSNHLRSLHQNFQHTIMTSSEPVQGPMLSILVSWARSIVNSPLNELPNLTPSTSNEDNAHQLDNEDDSSKFDLSTASMAV